IAATRPLGSFGRLCAPQQPLPPRLSYVVDLAGAIRGLYARTALDDGGTFAGTNTGTNLSIHVSRAAVYHSPPDWWPDAGALPSSGSRHARSVARGICPDWV